VNVGGEGNGEVGGAFHFALEDFGGGACLILTNLDDQLVVDLKNETGIQTALTERAIYGKHGELDHVGGGALNGTVHGDAFAERHQGLFGGGQLGNFAASAEECGNEAVAMCLLHHSGEILGHLGIAGEVALDIAGGFGFCDADILRKREIADAVDDAEIDRLCGLAHFGRDLILRNAEHLRGGYGVNVDAVTEGADHGLVTRNVGKQTQFDLRIVGID